MDDADRLSTAELSRSLVSGRKRMDAAEADWLAMLAAFDLREGWKADAMLSAVDWLECVRPQRSGSGSRTSYGGGRRFGSGSPPGWCRTRRCGP